MSKLTARTEPDKLFISLFLPFLVSEKTLPPDKLSVAEDALLELEIDGRVSAALGFIFRALIQLMRGNPNEATRLLRGAEACCRSKQEHALLYEARARVAIAENRLDDAARLALDGLWLNPHRDGLWRCLLTAAHGSGNSTLVDETLRAMVRHRFLDDQNNTSTMLTNADLGPIRDMPVFLADVAPRIHGVH